MANTVLFMLQPQEKFLILEFTLTKNIKSDEKNLHKGNDVGIYFFNK